MKRSRSDLIFDAVNAFITFLITLIMLYPLWFIIVASFSDPYLVAKGQVVFLPHGFTLEAYKNVFRNSDICYIVFKHCAIKLHAYRGLSSVHNGSRPAFLVAAFNRKQNGDCA
ncbi:MAG: hypothetical protein ACOX8S_00030 [Christensenellales bacterium]|jgi:ABC-type glycerol-3-phosphate transport system permease component